MQKLGVVAATLETVSLQQKSVSRLSSTIRIYRSDLSSGAPVAPPWFLRLCLTPTEVSIVASSPTAKANRSYPSSSFRLDRQLQTDVCVSIFLSPRESAELPIEHVGRVGQALSVTATSLLPVCSVAQNGDKRVAELPDVRTDEQTDKF